MYSFESSREACQQLSSKIFSDNQTIYFGSHRLYPEYIKHLHLANEVAGVFITAKKSNEYLHKDHLLFIGENYSKKLAELEKENIVHRYVRAFTHKGWAAEEYALLYKAASFKELLPIMLKVAENNSAKGVTLGQVCGPISTGGLGNVKDNLWAFNLAIQSLMKKGYQIMDQMPIEPIMHKLHAEWTSKGGEGYFTQILEDLYLPLFESGLIKKFYFMYGWESSTGAMWEHKQAERLKIEIEYLPIGIHLKDPWF